MLLVGSCVFAQDRIPADTLDKLITTHFEKHPPELYRYGGLTMYGETKSSFKQKQIDQELRFFEQLKGSELINKPSDIIFALNHNLLIHSPKSGQELLKLLNKPTADSDVISQLYLQVIFSGKFGEALALDNLESIDQAWSTVWANYLRKNAVYNSSIPRIQSHILKTTNEEIKLDLLSSLMYIGSPSSIDFVKKIIDTTKNDLVQTQAIFVYTELIGYNGIKPLEKVTAVGEKSQAEKKESIAWLIKETSQTNLFGTEVDNDQDFVFRFGDIVSPAMTWLENKGLLKEKSLEKPKPLSKIEKDEILDLLIKSKCFGLEAIKGALFLSIQISDLDKLMELRSLNFYSPNRFTEGRGKTLGILIRYLKKK